MNETSFLDNFIELGVSFFIWLKNSLRIDLHKLCFYDILIIDKKETRGMETLKNILGLIISISAVLGIFTGIINKMFSKRLQPLENRIEQGEKNSMKHDMSQLRFTIVSFANDLRNGMIKSKPQFDAIFSFMDEYEEMIETLHIKNGLFKEEEIYIREQYHKLIDNK